MRRSRAFVFLLAAASSLVFLRPIPALASAILGITPITWNVVGLDSNDVNVGPNNFPVSARVCNTGDTAATNVSSAFVWDSSDAYINLRPGSLPSYSGTNGVASLAPGACHDFYYEVQVTRDAAAYNHARRYHITTTADGLGTSSTTTPREIHVEHLISQSRNSTTNVRLNGISIPPGGVMALLVGNTYTIELDGSTATNGYNQIETFINFPNTIFQILSVSTTYTADSSPYVENPSDKLYGDGCLWDNDPNSPTYRSCVGVDGKAGGGVVVTYQIKIIGGGGTTQSLTNLIYDFSGSSYHYNSDYAVGARIAAIVDPTTVTIAKSFSPNPISAGGTSTLTFTLSNPNAAALSAVSFSDPLPTSPAAMVVAAVPNVLTANCGTPTVTALAGSGAISVANATLPANGSCTISVNVTAPAAGTYSNTSNHVFIDGMDTGHGASASLVVNNAPPPPPCAPGAALAIWRFSGLSTGYTFRSSRVSTASETYAGTGTPSIDTAIGNPVNSWKATGGWAANNTGYPNSAAPYFEFTLDSSNFSNVSIAFDFYLSGNWANPNNNYLYVYSSANGGAFGSIGAPVNPISRTTWYTRAAIPAASTGSSTTAFRINAVGQQNSTAALHLDNVVVTGCGVPEEPTLAKAFSPNPVAAGASSTLTFTLANPNPTLSFTNLTFTDTIPLGLTLADGASAQCGGTLTTAAPRSISFSGGTLAGGATCTIPVVVTASTAGVYNNVSGLISGSYSTGTGTGTITNTGPTGFGTATLTVLQPPNMAKLFAPNPILEGGISRLTFTIRNPNLDFPLLSVQFSDTLPSSPAQMQVANPPSALTAGCGSPSFTPAAGATSLSFSGGTIAAGGTCNVSVDVTAPLAGSYANTSGNVQATIAGTPTIGNPASDALLVQPVHPRVSILKRVSTSPSGPWTIFAGTTVGSSVYYQLTVENTGDVPLTSVNVTDPTLSGLGVSLAGCTWANMPLYDVQTCVVGPVTAVAGSHANTATAHGTYSGTVYDSTPSTATYATLGLSIVKSLTAGSPYDSVGDVLTYNYLVTNSGYVTLGGPFAVFDDRATDEACPPTTTLAPGASITCTASYLITQTDLDNGSVTNAAYATGSYGGGTVTSNTDTETATATQAPALAMVKSITAGSPYDSVGDVISYSYLVTNSGNVTLSGPFSVFDDHASDEACPATATLAPGASITCTASYTVTQADLNAGSVTNAAYATGSFGVTTVTSNTDTETATATQAPALTIDKGISAGSPYDSVGDIVSYTYQVLNTGNVTLDGPFAVFDDRSTDESCPATASLAPGGSITCTASHTITQSDLDVGSVTNAAYATGSFGGGTVTSNTDTEVAVANQILGLTINKTIASGSPYDSVGDVVSYSFLLTNTGTVTLDGPFTVFDDHATDEWCPVTPTLAPGVSIGCTASYTITQADLDAGSVTNAAYATGSFDGGTVASNTDSETASATQSPALAIDKTIASGSPYDSVGDVISYNYLLTNSGNVTLGGPFVVLDDHATDEACPVVATLAPGASLTCTATYTITQTDLDAGSVTNAAYATAAFDGGTVTSNTDTATATATQAPGLTIVKSITSGSPYDSVGDVISYSYLVTNSGNVTLDGPFSVFDDHATDEACPAAATLVPGASITCTATYTIIQTDLDTGSVTNEAYVTGSFEGGSITSNTDSETATATQSPALTIVKAIASGSPYDSVGDVISYSYLVTNSGNVTLDGPFTVFDDHATDEACPATASLVPGASIGCTATYTIAQADLDDGSVVNAAYATGSFEGGTITSNTDTETATASQSPALTIVKSITAGSPYDSAGDVISYSYLVTNSGNVTLDGPFTVFDDHATDEACPPTATLGPGASIVCTASYTITPGDVAAGSVTNAAYATGSFNGGTVTSNTDTETASATQVPGLTIVKSIASGDPYNSVGDVISYSYLVTNTGNVTLDGPFTVLDDHAADESCPATIALAPGNSITCTASYTITQGDLDAGTVTNAAYATGSYLGGTITSNTDTETATATQSPGLTILKTLAGGSPYASVGDVLSYSFLLTNSGNVTLDGPFTVFDDRATDEACPVTATLAPGASITCTASYTIVQADIDAGAVTNAAYATGSFESGTVTSNTDTETATSTQAPALILVKSITAGSPYDSVGDIVSYSFLLTNSGNVTLDGPFSVLDDHATDESCPATATLAPGASITCSASYTITQADLDAGFVTNAAYGTGSFESITVTSNTDTATATATQSPALSLIKSITAGTPYDSLGDVVSYSFLVTNSGNVTLDGPFVVHDDHATDESCPAAATLAPAASITCTATYTITQADLDAGFVTNAAYATGSFESGTVTSNTDTETATATQSPALTLAKSITSGSPYLAVGDVISYSFLVTNSGNVTLDGPFVVHDDHATDESCPATATLAPGAFITCTATYTIVQADLDAASVTNAAYATGSFESGTVTSNTDTATATGTAGPELTLVKSITGGDPYDTAGDILSYSFLLTNTGNVTLDGPFSVYDDHASDEWCPAAATLAPLASITCTASYTITPADILAESVTNAAYATGSYGGGTVTSNTDTETAVVLLADLTVTKGDSPDPVYTNGSLTYTLHVANLGPSTAANISVVDTLPAGVAFSSASGSGWTCGESGGVVTCTRAALPVGSAPDITITVTAPAAPGTLTNTVTVTTTTTESDTGNNDDSEDTDVIYPPGLLESFAKDLVLSNQAFTVPPQVAIGEILTYEITMQVANGTLPGAAVRDVLNRGLAFVGCDSISAPAQVIASAGTMAQVCSGAAVSEVPSGSVDPQDQGRQVRFDFGTLTNTGLTSATITIRYRAVVLDSAANVAGLSLINAATWEGPGGPISDSAPAVTIVEPRLEVDKSASPTVAAPGSEVTFDLVVSAAPSAPLAAFDLVLRDAIPVGLSFHPGTLDCTLGPQPPSTCSYNLGTNEIVATWSGASGFQPSLGNGIIRFGATVGAVAPGTVITNEALLSWTSLPGDVSDPQSPYNDLSTERFYDPPSTVNTYGDSDTADITIPQLPQTGFAPGLVTDIGPAPAEQPFESLGGLRLTIPSIDVEAQIVGVPLGEQGWDLTWLADQVGYLEGTAYPTWNGNTGLTAHVYLPNGEPGPFVRLSELGWGDRVVIEAFGQRYTYEVRETKLVKPDDARTLRHEERPWLTLITCQGYDEQKGEYRWRRVVRAVLVEVDAAQR